jgi:hypothetical protein
MSHPDAVPTITHAADRRSQSLSPAIASATLGVAFVLGVVGDSLLDVGFPGAGFPMWVALIALSGMALAWRADLAVPRESAGWYAVAIALATCSAWRDAETLQVFNTFGTVGALVLGAAAMNRDAPVLFAARLRDSAFAFAHTFWTALIGIFPLAFREAPASAASVMVKSRLARYARATIIVAALLLVFGALLRSADPIFASLIALPSFDVNEVFNHLIIIGVFTALLGGGARATLLAKQERAGDATLPFFRLSSVEVTAALVTLNVLFAAYVLAQLGWFFGGEQFLRERTGLTVAQYARGGFFQMLVVVALVVPLLIATRSALEPGRALARRHTLLALPIVGLLGAIIVSAASRMQLYVRYYGLSVDRVYPVAVMAWLAIVLVWMTLTVLRGRPRTFTAGAAISALATLFTLNVVSPDRIVARVNLARAGHTANGATPLDIVYLAQLSGEATGLAIQAVLTPPTTIDANARCEAARMLLVRWGPESNRRKSRDVPAAWRSWNAGAAAGLQAVSAHSAELRPIAHTCADTKTSPAPVSAAPQR